MRLRAVGSDIGMGLEKTILIVEDVDQFIFLKISKRYSSRTEYLNNVELLTFWHLQKKKVWKITGFLIYTHVSRCYTVNIYRITRRRSYGKSSIHETWTSGLWRVTKTLAAAQGSILDAGWRFLFAILFLNYCQKPVEKWKKKMTPQSFEISTHKITCKFSYVAAILLVVYLCTRTPRKKKRKRPTHHD